MTPYCECCSSTCVSANWVMTMVGVVLAIAIVAIPISAIQVLAWATEGALSYPDQVDTNFFWITFVLEVAQQFYDVGVMGTIFVTMWLLRGPARRHENEPKRVGSPLHRKNVVIFTVLIALAIVMNVLEIFVLIIWMQVTKIDQKSVTSTVLVLVLDIAWYVWGAPTAAEPVSMPAMRASARARSHPSFVLSPPLCRNGGTIGALWAHWHISKRAVAFNATHDVDPGVPMHGAALPHAVLVQGGSALHGAHVVHGGAHPHLPQAVVAPQTGALHTAAPVVNGTIVTATLVQQEPAPAAQQQAGRGSPGPVVPTVVLNPAPPHAGATQPQFVAQANATPLG